MIVMSKAALARAAATAAAVAVFAAAVPAGSVFAQQSPTVALEQARSGEDGTSGAGATSGSMTSGNDSAKRDKNGNGGTASAGSAGPSTTGTASDGTGNSGGGGNGGGGNGGGGEEASSAPPLPENAEVLDALGILDDVTVYGLDVLSGLDIPVELLPAPVEEPASSVPDDINTGGQGSSGSTSNVSTEPGSGSAPAGGSTNTVAADGTNSSSGGEKTRDRPRKGDDEAAG
jgi:hypothetical protein